MKAAARMPRARMPRAGRRRALHAGRAAWPVLLAGLGLLLPSAASAQQLLPPGTPGTAPQAATEAPRNEAPAAAQAPAQTPVQDDGPALAPDDLRGDAGNHAAGGSAGAAQDEASSGASAEALPRATDVELLAPGSPVLLGDLLQVEARGPALLSLKVDAGEHLGDVLVTEAEPRADGADAVLQLGLRLLREGSYRLPLTVLRSDGRLESLPPLELEVQLDLPVGRKPRVAQLLDPMLVSQPVAPSWPFLVAATAGLVLVGAWIVAAGRRRPVYTYAPPPDQVAIAALARLRLELPRTSEEIRPFVIRVSDVLRTYVEGAFAMHAPAQTTEEFLAAAARRQDALGERRSVLGEFLQHCDLVKYAGERPAPAAALPLLDTVEGFVVETRVALSAAAARSEPAAPEVAA